MILLKKPAEGGWAVKDQVFVTLVDRLCGPRELLPGVSIFRVMRCLPCRVLAVAPISATASCVILSDTDLRPGSNCLGPSHSDPNLGPAPCSPEKAVGGKWEEGSKAALGQPL